MDKIHVKSKFEVINKVALLLYTYKIFYYPSPPKKKS